MPELHSLFMDAIHEEHTRLSSRRGMVRGGAKLATGGAIAAAAAGSPALARLMAAAQEFTDDIDILNYALTLEHLEFAFYRDGLAGYNADIFADGVFDNLMLVRDHEGAHVDALVSAITDVGGQPVAEQSYDFGYSSAEAFIGVAAALENTGVSAYDGAAAAIQNVDYLNAAGSIVAIEARHASYLNLVNNMDPFPAAFETPLSRSEVLDIAGPFIISG